MAMGADSDGISRAQRLVHDNQMPGATSQPGYVEKPGTKGTGMSNPSAALPGTSRRKHGGQKNVGSGGRRGGSDY